MEGPGDNVQDIFANPMLDYFFGKFIEKSKSKTECKFPGCFKMSRADYCSAEHCEKHKKNSKIS